MQIYASVIMRPSNQINILRYHRFITYLDDSH